MKVTLDGDALYGAVSWVAKLLPTRPAVSILAGILIEADDQLRLSAFDLETAGTVTAAGTVLEPGRVLVSGRLLASVAKTVRGDHVDLVTEGRALRVTAGTSTWSLPLMSVENYPALPQTSEPLGEVDGEVLGTALSRVLPAVARGKTAEARPELTGVAMSADGGQLSLAATDSYRLAVVEVEWPGEPFEQLLVPAGLLTDAIRAFGTTVVLHADDATFTVISGGHRITGRLIAKKFVRFDGLLRFDAVATVVLPRAALIQVVDRAATVLSPSEVLRLAIDADGCEVSGISEDESSAGSSCPVTSHEGESLDVGVGPHYLADALARMGSEMVLLTVSGRGGRPLLFRPADQEGRPVAGYRHLVMSRKLRPPA